MKLKHRICSVFLSGALLTSAVPLSVHALQSFDAEEILTQEDVLFSTLDRTNVWWGYGTAMTPDEFYHLQYQIDGWIIVAKEDEAPPSDLAEKYHADGEPMFTITQCSAEETNLPANAERCWRITPTAKTAGSFYMLSVLLERLDFAQSVYEIQRTKILQDNGGFYPYGEFHISGDNLTAENSGNGWAVEPYHDFRFWAASDTSIDSPLDKAAFRCDYSEVFGEPSSYIGNYTAFFMTFRKMLPPSERNEYNKLLSPSAIRSLPSFVDDRYDFGDWYCEITKYSDDFCIAFFREN